MKFFGRVTSKVLMKKIIPLLLLIAFFSFSIDFYVAKGNSADAANPDEYFKNEENIKILKQAAKNNHMAAFKLGMYYVNIKKPADYKKAAEWFHLSSKQGNIEAQVIIGYLYLQGKGVIKNKKKGFKLIRLALEKAPSLPSFPFLFQAQFFTGVNYYNGIEAPLNYDKSIPWLQKAAKNGSVHAKSLLGWIYFSGVGAKQDKKKGYEWFQSAAKNGDKVAQLALGWINRFGFGVTDKNEKKSLFWFNAAKEQGSLLAEKILADHYFDEGNFKLAAKGFQKLYNSDKNQRPKVLFKLANFYWEGNGLAKDRIKALELFKLAAEKGSAPAQQFLGKIYFNGDGVSKNYKEAIKWFKVATTTGQHNAHRRNTAAQVKLGLIYLNGLGVKKSLKEALKWFKGAAIENDPVGQRYTGLSYFKTGGSKNNILAYIWLTYAMLNGDEEAFIIRKNLEKKLSVEQQSEALKLTDWEKRIELLEKVSKTTGCDMEFWKLCDANCSCTDYDQYLIKKMNPDLF